ncbi:MAG: hypothetical protein IJV40_10645 [Oscillospiraceae bacterium]|nr:hypothetical protein [Oscillospiraceae bacterium]
MEHWLIPCNVRIYDVPAHFAQEKTIVWRNTFSMRKGDAAFIYLGSPYGEIRYKCKVISDTVDEDTLMKNAYAIPAKVANNYYSKRVKYVKLELEKEYPANFLSLNKLREHGLGQVQIQARIDRRLLKYIENEELLNEMPEKGDINA